MGYYIPTEGTKEKADEIAIFHDGQIVNQPSSFDQIPKDKALICVVQNTFFDAAAFIHDAREFERFTYPEDRRPKKWVIIERSKAEQLSGYAAAQREAENYQKAL